MIGSVVASPFVYARVEPHIRITMDVSQTTKPIQVIANNGTEVFSVDVDGTISPQQGIPVSDNLQVIDEGTTALLYTQTAELTESFSIPSFDFDAMTELALWRIDFSSSDDEVGTGQPITQIPSVTISDGHHSGFVKSDTGATVEVRIAWKTTTFPDYLEVLGTIEKPFTGFADDIYAGQHQDSDTGIRDTTMCDRDAGDLDPCFIRIAWGNTDVSKTGLPVQGKIKDYKFYLSIILPNGATLTRVT